MKTNLFLFAALTAAFLSVSSFSAAQVTIGGSDAPKAGTILDLNSTTKGGLLLSNVELTSLTDIPATFPNANAISTPTEKQALAGMIVWNTNDYLIPNGDGLYLWDGSKWNYWGGSNGVSILTGAGLPTGSGTFSGKTCFDIVKSNFSGSCAPEAGRESQQTDFSDRNPQDGAAAPYTGVQIYTFKRSGTGTVSNVRFGFIEAVGAGKIVESIVPVADYSGTISVGSDCKVKVYYKETLQSTLVGKTRDQALKLKLYAVYNDGTSDKTLELNISLQDCACCGAYISKEPKVWKAFMCHNLGANEGADPFTPSKDIQGAMYKFGLKDTIISQATNVDPLITSISWWTDSVPPSSGDWNMTDANPCPPGWKVPSKTDWDNVLSSNTLYRTNDGGSSWVAGTQSSGWTNSATNYSTGLKIGDALVLPAAGLRGYSNGSLNYRGSTGYYWSSTANGARGYYLNFYSDGQGTGSGSGDRSYGYSVRCVAE